MSIKNRRFVFWGIIISVVLVVCVCLYKDCNYVLKGIENYNQEESSFALSDLGEYKSVYYQSAKRGDHLFNSTGSMFIADYDLNAFNKQVFALNQYKYVDEIVMFDDDEYIIPNPTFDIGNWNFKIIADTGYPKIFDFVAVNKNGTKIAYLTFNDQDLDYLCKVKENSKNDYMQKFVKKYFAYNFK